MASIGSLVVDLIAETAAFRSDLSKASAHLKTEVGAMRKSVEGLASGFNLVTKAAGAIVAAGVIQQVGQGIKGLLEYADDLGDTAAKIGVTSEFLQETRYAAEQAGASWEVADAGLARFVTTLGDAKRGSETALATLKLVGITAGDLNKGTRDLFVQAADGMAKLEDGTVDLSVATDLFGKKNSELVNLMRLGSGGFNSLAREARELNVVLSDDLVESAGSANDKLDAMKRILTAQMASAVAANAGAILTLANNTVSAAGALAQFWAQNPERAMAIAGALAGASLGRAGGPWGAGIGAVAGAVAGWNMAPAAPRTPDTIAAEIAELQASLTRGFGVPEGSRVWKERQAQLDQLRGEWQRALMAQPIGPASPAAAEGGGVVPHDLVRAPSSTKEKSALAEYREEVAATKEAIANFKEAGGFLTYKDLTGEDSESVVKFDEVAREGREFLRDTGQAAADTLDGLVEDSQRAAQDITSYGLDAIGGWIKGYHTLGDIGRRVLDDLLDATLELAAQHIFGASNVASTGNIFSTIMSGAAKFATGGRIAGPGSGRSDSILARVSNGEFIVNAAATARNLPLLTAINDNRLPRFANGGPVGVSVPGAAALDGSGGRVVGLEVVPSPYFDVRVHQVAAPLAAKAAAGGSAMAQRDIKKRARRKLR